MNRLAQKIRMLPQAGLVGVLCLALPAASMASISNVATVRYADAAAVGHTGTSNAVSTLTPPVISGANTASGDVGVVFVNYSITATESPTSYAIASSTPLPTGLTLNTGTGVISGTPTQAGVFPVMLTATNAAGTSAGFTLTITIRGAPAVTLVKSSNRATATTGTVITYSIQYQNSGTGNASNVVISDVIPAGTTLVPGSITAGGTVAAGTITWNIGTVAAGAPAQTVSFQVTAN